MKFKPLLLLSSVALLASCGGSSNTGLSTSQQPSATGLSVSQQTSESSSAPSISSIPSVAKHQVTFDYNFASSVPTVVEVSDGQKVSKPADPAREGYNFNGWFKEAAGENAFDFDAPITAAVTAYASWTEIKENTRFATFYMNDGTDTVYAKVAFDAGTRPTTPSDPTKDGKNFRGWYTDAACTTAYVRQKYNEDINVYAKWFNVYTWEAELTQLTEITDPADSTKDRFGNKIGHGYSSDVSGLGLIFIDDEHSDCKASNGYYITDLYYYGGYLEFDITVSKAVTDAVLVARLSAEYFDMSFVPGEKGASSKEGPHGYDFLVNGEPLSYTQIDITGVPTGRADAKKREFSNFTITSKLALNEGENVIKMVTKNSNRQDTTGTMAAMAPMIDCLYCYSDAEIEFTEFPNLED